MKKQKDRLVELIGEGLLNYSSWSTEMALAGNYDMPSAEEVIADKLLADGWMRPPCKVGDVVYRIVEMSTGVNKVFKRALCPPYTCETIINCKPTIKRFIRSVVVTKNNFLDVVENWGKTVFLTKEEAEAKLKEGVQG